MPGGGTVLDSEALFHVGGQEIHEEVPAKVRAEVHATQKPEVPLAEEMLPGYVLMNARRVGFANSDELTLCFVAGRIVVRLVVKPEKEYCHPDQSEDGKEADSQSPIEARPTVSRIQMKGVRPPIRREENQTVPCTKARWVAGNQ